MNDKSKEIYLAGCGMFYDETTRFLKDTGLLE